MPRGFRIGHVRDTRLAAEAGALALTGVAASLARRITLVAAQSAYTLVGRDATFVHNIPDSSVPASAQVSGPTTVAAAALATYTVTLKTASAITAVASQVYIVTWLQDGVSAGTTNIVIGESSTSIDLSWSTDGLYAVDFTISPSLPRTGNPLAVSVVAATEDDQILALYGPSSGGVSSASEVFSVRGVNLVAPTTVTPIIRYGAGTFSPASLVVPAGSENVVTFTFTPSERGVHHIGIDNNIGILPPIDLYYIAEGGARPTPDPIVIQPGVVTGSQIVAPRYLYTDTAGGRYDRFETYTEWDGTATSVSVDIYKAIAGSALTSFNGSQYTLLIDDVVAATVNVTPHISTQATFTVNPSLLTSGWRKVTIGGLTGSEVNPVVFVFVYRAGMTMPDKMPVWTGSHTTNHFTYGRHGYTWVPAKRQAPYIAPLTRTEFPYFSHVPAKSELVMEEYCPNINAPNNDTHRPLISRDHGVWHTQNRNAYKWGDVVAKYPVVPLLDGPRGYGTCMYIFHVEVGTAEPSSTGPINNIYFCDPWRVCKIRNNGTIITLAGWRHKQPPEWKPISLDTDTDPPDPQLELVGDWSAIAPERRGFHELWGIAWNSDTLTIDPNSPTIPLERNLQQHFEHGPAMFVTDTQWKRVCKIQFTYEAHNIQPKVTEFITHYSDTGLPFGEPWDLQEWRDELIVSDRTNNKIVAFYKNTGQFKRTILSKTPFLSGQLVLDGTRQAYRVGTLEQCQAHDCLGPEGLYVLDDWLYFGSFVQNQVRRVHLETGVLQVCVADIRTDSNSNYAKIAVSDGTFGPRHSIFVQTWSNAVYADKRAYAFNGTSWDVWSLNTGSNSAPITGKTGTAGWVSSGYGAAVGVAKGRLVIGSSSEGLRRFSLALPSDSATYNSALYTQGFEEYISANLQLQYGTKGFGFYGFPAPYGISAAIDYFLQWNGVPP